MRAPTRLLSCALVGFLVPGIWGCDRESWCRPAADHTPPSAVTDLAAIVLSDSSFLLTWSAPGGDDDPDSCVLYDVRGALDTTTVSWWNSAAVAFPYPDPPRAAPAAESLAVTVPAPGSVWYFAMKAGDETGNWSELSNIATGMPPAVDLIAPATIPDLVERAIGSTSVQLVWTATGDDGTRGIAHAYDLRWSLTPITAEGWLGAVPVTGLPEPGLPGTTEVFTVEALTPATVYFFAIRATDEAGNQSDLSAARPVTTSAAAGRLIEVRPDGSGDYSTIQAAIDSATAGDVIELTDGTFHGDGNRDIDFRGKAITVRSRSNDPATCIIDCEGNAVRDHRGFLFASGEGPLSVLEAVTITHAFNTTDWSGLSGAALYCFASSPTISHCAIWGNAIGCRVHTGCDTRGAGMYGVRSSPRIDHCFFAGNTGGLVFYSDSSPTFTDCKFAGDRLSCWDSQPVVADCVFQSTRAGDDLWSAFDCVHTPTAIVTRCSFRGCYSHDAAALSCSEGNITINGCTFLDNRSDGAGYWQEYNFYGRGVGAVTCNNAEGLLIGCVFAGNRATGDYWDPPRAAGAILSEQHSRVTLIGCTLNRNEPYDYYDSCALIVVVDASSVVLENTILAATTAGVPVYCDATSQATASCSDVFGNAGGDWVAGLDGQSGQNGNLALDPLFCDPEDRVFTLSAHSPCLPESTGCGLIGTFGLGCE